MTEEGGSGDNDSATQSNDQEAETDAAQVSLFLSLSLSLFGRDLFERQKARNRFAKSPTIMMEIRRMSLPSYTLAKMATFPLEKIPFI